MSVKVTVRGIVPDVGVAVNPATGAGTAVGVGVGGLDAVTYPDFVFVLLPAEFAAVSVTV